MISRTRGSSEVVVHGIHTSNGVARSKSITEIFIKLCEGNCLSGVGAINRFSEDSVYTMYISLTNQ